MQKPEVGYSVVALWQDSSSLSVVMQDAEAMAEAQVETMIQIHTAVWTAQNGT